MMTNVPTLKHDRLLRPVNSWPVPTDALVQLMNALLTCCCLRDLPPKVWTMWMLARPLSSMVLTWLSSPRSPWNNGVVDCTTNSVMMYMKITVISSYRDRAMLSWNDRASVTTNTTGIGTSTYSIPATVTRTPIMLPTACAATDVALKPWKLQTDRLTDPWHRVTCTLPLM